MKMDLYLCEYLEKQTFANEEHGYILNGCEQLYRATGTVFYKEKVKELFRLEETERSPQKALTDVVNSGKVLYRLYDETGKKEYQNKVIELTEQLKCLPRNTDGVWQMRPEELYRVMPFYMQYETELHNKAEYNDIVLQLQKAEQKEQEPITSVGWYLMTLIDVMDSMSIEIFEHYKSLERIFKKTIRRVLSIGQKDQLKILRNKKFGTMECAMLGYAVVKACNLGVLSSEKYAEIGIWLMDGAIDGPLEEQDFTTMGIIMMAYAQCMIYRNR